MDVIIENSEVYGTIKGRFVIIRNSKIGKETVIWNFVNIYDSEIGEGNTIGSYVEIGESKIGDGCKIEAKVFIPPGTKIGNYVFIGPDVLITNDKYPVAVGKWKLDPVIIEDYVSIGAGAIILPGVRIGKYAVVGSGSIVTKDIPSGEVWVGNPARKVGTREEFDRKRLGYILKDTKSNH